MSDIHKVENQARAGLDDAIFKLGLSKAEDELKRNAQFVLGYIQALKLFPGYQDTSLDEKEARFDLVFRSQSAKLLGD